MKIELHMIQNFAPACLNRDDTNSPKDCEFGGVRRARISSQCLKRAIREHWRKNDMKSLLGLRTARLLEDVATDVAPQVNAERSAVLAAAKKLVGAVFVKKSKPNKKTGELLTSYLVFLSEDERSSLKEYLVAHWDLLAKAAEKAVGEAAKDDQEDVAEDDDGKGEKKDNSPLGKAVAKALKDHPLMLGRVSPDIALFGRMLADLPSRNVDAACQVAHAISTNKVSMELDFFTAVDDLKTDAEDAGAGMMGVIGYNSACFYRYAVLDLDQLLENLGNDADLARRTVEALIRASALAVPTGKQNTFAAHSRPDLIVASVHDQQPPLSLVNAFVAPARPTDGQDLTQVSANKLADFWTRVTSVYGNGAAGTFCCGTTLPAELPSSWKNVGSLDQLVASVLQAAQPGGRT